MSVLLAQVVCDVAKTIGQPHAEDTLLRFPNLGFLLAVLKTTTVLVTKHASAGV